MAHRLRHSSLGGGKPLPRLRKARRPRHRTRRRRRHPASPSGRPTPAASRVIGDFNGWRRRPTSMHPVRLVRHLGVFRPRRRPGALYKYAITSQSQRLPRREGRPLRLRRRDPARRPRRRSGTSPGYDWDDDDWMAQPRRAARRSTHPCRSTKSISAPGGAIPEKAIAG